MSVRNDKPLASLSLDLDDKWSYMKTHGNPEWVDFPSYLDVVIPRFLALLAERNFHITVFIVGQDAALPRNHAVLRSLVEAGHGVGNHSFHHEPWLHLYTPQQLEDEIGSAEDAIAQATGVRPRGFRGPGFSVSEQVIDTLAARGYEFDASTLPTFIGPLARAYYFFTAKLDAEERRKRAQLFGKVADCFRPLRPYIWKTSSREILEIPVTTIPILRTPFHLSYLIYLCSVSRALAIAYLRLAVALASLTRTPISFLLHPLDFLGAADAPELSFFPGMNMPIEQKLGLAREVLGILDQHFRVVSMSEHARTLRAGSPALRTYLIPAQ